ncbi:MAG: InlB B-repeat-containing protein, partial [Treponema sp.]|nr:InlB B-repeat-containing protein [Treponema sp.]
MKHISSLRQVLLSLAVLTFVGFAGCKSPADPPPDSYTTTINAGGQDCAAIPKDALAGDMVTLNAGSRAGYKFTGWTVTKPAGMKITGNQFAMPVNGIEVTAEWEAILYDITVNSEGSSSADKNQASIGEIVTLSRGTRPDYGFTRWEVVKPAGLTITDDVFTMPAAEVEVTAIWKAGEFSTRITDGGDGASANPQPAELHQTVTLNPGNKPGHTFAGWTVDSPSSGVTINNNTFTMPNSDVEVTASWTKIVYTIEVQQGGGTGSSASPKSTTIGETVMLSHGNRPGYNPDGWTVIAPSGFSFNGDSFAMPADNVEVTAKWKAISYDITVNQNSGSGSEAKPNPATVGQTVTL